MAGLAAAPAPGGELPAGLPPPLPGIVAAVGEAELRWLCLRLAEELRSGPLAAAWALEADEFSGVAEALAELILGGLAGRQQRAAAAWQHLQQRRRLPRLDPGQRRAWLGIWQRQLARSVPLPALAHPLEGWMAALTRLWTAGENRVVSLHCGTG